MFEENNKFILFIISVIFFSFELKIQAEENTLNRRREESQLIITVRAVDAYPPQLTVSSNQGRMFIMFIFIKTCKNISLYIHSNRKYLFTSFEQLLLCWIIDSWIATLKTGMQCNIANLKMQCKIATLVSGWNEILHP